MPLTEKRLEQEKQKIIEGLVDFYYEVGHESRVRVGAVGRPTPT